MSNKSIRVDAHINKSSAFAQPIVKALRGKMQRAGPQFTEAMKKRMPFFDYKGPVCNMAAIWRGEEVVSNDQRSCNA